MRPVIECFLSFIGSFQFTHPRRVRQGIIESPAWGDSFNSRTRVGCDSYNNRSVSNGSRFNSRTRVGCDIRVSLYYPTIQCFNSRTRVGCDSRNDNMFILLYQRGGFREPRDIGGRNRSSFQFRYFNLQRTKLLESPRTFRSFSYSLMFAEAIKSGESRQYRRILWFLCEELYCLLSFP